MFAGASLDENSGAFCELKANFFRLILTKAEDLGFTSLDFMSFLGELEDTFDIELEETEVTKITTLEEALKLLEELQ